MEKLGINAIQLLAQLINFGIILFVFKKFLYQPVLTLLEKRKQTIEKSIKLSSEMEAKIASLETKEKELEHQVKAKASQEILSLRKESEKQAKEMITQTQKDAKKIQEQAKSQITAQIEREKAKLEAQVNQKALSLANKALDELLPKEIKFRLTEAQIKKVGRQKG